jgi:hypothetical protein
MCDKDILDKITEKVCNAAIEEVKEAIRVLRQQKSGV